MRYWVKISRHSSKPPSKCICKFLHTKGHAIYLFVNMCQHRFFHRTEVMFGKMLASFSFLRFCVFLQDEAALAQLWRGSTVVRQRWPIWWSKAVWVYWAKSWWLLRCLRDIQTGSGTDGGYARHSAVTVAPSSVRKGQSFTALTNLHRNRPRVHQP